MSTPQLVILAGMSGSGKSTALDAFEDMGYFCVDNLPTSLIGHFVELVVGPGVVNSTGVKAGSFALLVECREPGAFGEVKAAIKKLKDVGGQVRVLFFDCQDEVILRRYRETRRPHPLLMRDGTMGSAGGAIGDALLRERELLDGFRGSADLVVDTTGYSPHELRQFIQSYGGYVPSLEIVVESFGFKYGVPYDVDLVADVRFLPNPHFVPHLRELDGRDQGVSEYVFQAGDAVKFLEHYGSLLEFLIPRYQKEGKRYLKINIGCTGGKHRSVAVAVRLAGILEAAGYRVTVSHRDVSRAG